MLPVINAEFAAWWIFDDELKSILNPDFLVYVNPDVGLTNAYASALGYGAVAWR